VSTPHLLSFLVLTPPSFYGLQFVSNSYFWCGDSFIFPLFVRKSVHFYLLVLGVLIYLLYVWQDIFSRLGSFVADVLSLSLHFYHTFTNARLAIPFDI
jgi:hypothetical protein